MSIFSDLYRQIEIEIPKDRNRQLEIQIITILGFKNLYHVEKHIIIRFGQVNTIDYCLRGIFSFKCVLIGFALPNLSLIYLTEIFKTLFLTTKNILNYWKCVVNSQMLFCGRKKKHQMLILNNRTNLVLKQTLYGFKNHRSENYLLNITTKRRSPHFWDYNVILR